MNKNSPLSFIIIIVVGLLAAWYLYPSITYYSKSPEQRRVMREKDPTILKKILNLGLDLQGGMRLVLQVDDSGMKDAEKKDLLDRAYAILENRINGLGVAEPVIQKQGTRRLIIELPGLKNASQAKSVLGSTAQLEFSLLREPTELQRALNVVEEAVSGDKSDDAADDTTGVDSADVVPEEVKETAEQLFSGSDEDTTESAGDGEGSAAGDDTTAVAAADTTAGDTVSFMELLVPLSETHIGVLESNRGAANKILQREDVQAALSRAGLGSSKFLWDHTTMMIEGREYRSLYYVKGRPELKGDIIKDANATIGSGGMDAGNWIVNLEMNGKGARRFSRVTATNTGKYLAIILDSTVYSAPVIRQKIPHGNAQISGSFTPEEAKGLAVVLRAGALPAPVIIEEERTVGPSLGQDSIMKGTQAFILGFVLVILFMVIYYKGSGLIAIIALLLNLVFVVAIMASVGATLTLPGFAGLILIIGMAVDANVIIFERIREELAIGKTVRSAVDSGFSRAFLTIIDANLTTLITAGILYAIGTGPIKGFAVTMTFGIIVSMFTALYVSRVIFNMFTSSRDIKKLSI